ncbi:hypothetical protein E4P40_22410 [Blastococcus sp. CT_GayMR20]|uniref:hypothetical protein n=1 Tax=Blastococcus sp. CT_GayMR20 TaxID=2559609 RepID=UPI001073C733|nr:hypothetical protein [Blastococcus sp. CT_GayMR20]TFV69281.1 hypothetical protein E4P40_22410 [Blastococcus sp. CT_GayMR20]
MAEARNEDNSTVPELPDLGGTIPAPWRALVEELGQTNPGTPRHTELAAQLRVWLTFADLRARQLASKTATTQAKFLNRATWVLAFATIALIVATVVAAFA